MLPIAAERVAWCLCVCVCLSVFLLVATVNRAKTAEPINMQWSVDSLGVEVLRFVNTHLDRAVLGGPAGPAMA